LSACFDAIIYDLGFIARHIGFHCPVLYKKTTRHWSRTSFGRGKQLDLKKLDSAVLAL
jgi:hypothetical protein